MEKALPLIMAAVLGAMPVAAYYLGWLAGRPHAAHMHRVVFRIYLAVMACALGVATCAVGLDDEHVTFWMYFVPVGVVLLLSPTLSIWFFFKATPAGDLQDSCLECGYDLRGNVSGRCPECGFVCASHSIART